MNVLWSKKIHIEHFHFQFDIVFSVSMPTRYGFFNHILDTNTCVLCPRKSHLKLLSQLIPTHDVEALTKPTLIFCKKRRIELNIPTLNYISRWLFHGWFRGSMEFNICTSEVNWTESPQLNFTRAWNKDQKPSNLSYILYFWCDLVLRILKWLIWIWRWYRQRKIFLIDHQKCVVLLQEISSLVKCGSYDAN